MAERNNNMGLPLLFMALVLGLNGASNAFPNLINSRVTIKSSSYPHHYFVNFKGILKC